ncbi:MAG TPA: septal ring lytic transglycosylase RlpA family protein [Solirubrobacteraceae bacterium]|jgi:hypothetical protein
MRSNVIPRAGGLACALGISALSLTAAAPAASAAAPTFKLNDTRLAYGERVEATGRLGAPLAGRRVSLQLRRAGSPAWRELAAAPAGKRGRFSVRSLVPRTGALRIAVSGVPEASRERGVRVTAGLEVSDRRLHVTAGRRASVAGRVRPGIAGSTVRLQVLRRGGWRTIDADRTGRNGGYSLARRSRATLSARARLQVSTPGVAPSSRSLGRLNVYRRAYASWYGPGLYGNLLGCGGRLGPGTLGVAHKTLPCGTKLTIRYGSRSVRVRVIDRGPYVGGREFDLTAATAQRLGFHGHGWVQSTR